GRRETGILPEFPNLVDAPVGRAVDLDDIQGAGLADTLAGDADAAGLIGGPLLAVEPLAHQAGQGCLPCAPGPGKEVGMSEASQTQALPQGTDDGLLAHHLVKGLGPPLPV